MYKIEVKIDGKWEPCFAGTLATRDEADKILADYKRLHPNNEYQIIPISGECAQLPHVIEKVELPIEDKARIEQVRSNEVMLTEMRANVMRDEIAMRILLAAFSSGNVVLTGSPKMMKGTAHDAYKFADAMLEARSVKDDKP